MLIFLVNMPGLLLKEKEVTTMTHAFKIVLINLEKEVNQRKQDQIKVVNFKTGQWNHGYNAII